MKLRILFFAFIILNLQLVFAAAGDDCSTSILVSSNGCSSTGQYTNSGITGTLTAPSCFSTGTNNGMWFSFLASGPVVNIQVNASTLSVAQFALLSNATGCTGTFTEVACVKGTTATTSLTYSNLTAGTKYYIYVDGVNNNVGTFQLCLTSPSQPSNDQVCNAITLQANNFCSPSGGYTNVGATSESLMGTLPSCINTTDQINSVYFKFTAIGSSNTITVNGSASGLARPQFLVFSMTPDCNATSYSLNGCSVATSTSNTTTLNINNLIAGNTYYIMVDGNGTGTGAFQICVNSYVPTSTVQNDDCSSAIVLCPGNRYYSTTKGATPNTNKDPYTNGGGEWNCNGVVDNSVWFTYTTPSTVTDVTFSVNSTCVNLGGSYTDGGYLQFEVFKRVDGLSNCANRSTTGTGTWASLGNCVTVGPGGPATNTLTIPASAMQANKQYYIVVDNYPSCGCDFDFVINGNAGADAGSNQTLCVDASPVNMTGFTPVGGTWSGPGMTSGGTFSPSIAGVGTHLVYYTAGNCTDSKTITVSGPIVTVSNDVTICPSESVSLTGNVSGTSTYTINESVSPAITIPDDGITSTWTGTGGTFASSSITPTGLVAGYTFNSVTINITHAYDGDLIAWLFNPCGGSIKLISNNGSSGDDFTNTVFSRTATAAISSGSAPFTGTFIPAGGTTAWNTFLSCSTVGTWTLKVGDDGYITEGKLQSWSINLTNNVSPPTYVWSPTTNMTNSTTLSPTVSPSSTTTYTLTATDYLGCVNSDQVVVNVSSSITPTFTQVAPICSGGTFTLPTTSNNSITGTWSPAINNTTTTTYTFTPDAGQCATTTTMSVTVNAPTIPTFTQHQPICSGGTITLPTTSNNSITGTWSPAIDNTTTTTYTFTPGAGQCATTTTMTVTVGPPATPTFTQHQQICSGGTINLPTTSNESFTGTWSPAIDNTTTTTYTFTPGAGQCATTTTMTVTVGPPATPTFTQVAAVCSGETITLPTTSNESFTGTWSPAVDNTTTTTYTFTPGAGQCATTNTMTVTVNASTTPTFTQVAAICSGGTISLPTTSNNSITGTWTPTINNTTTTSYTFTPDAGQCASTNTMTVTVNAPTTPTFTQVAPICSGGTFTLPTSSNESITGTWSPAINNTTTTTYTFTPDAGQCATTATMTVTVGPPSTPTFTQVAPICSGGTFTLPTTSNNSYTGTWSPAIDNTITTTYTFTPGAGQCATTTTMTVTVNAPTTPTFTQVNAICSGETFTLPTTSNNSFTGTWSPAINNTATTTYTFTPSAGQCASTTTMTVTVNAPTTPTFTQVNAICSGGIFTLPTTSNNSFTGTWSPSINNTVTTTYTFTPTAGQCASTTTMSVTVNPLDNPMFTMIPTCDGGTASISGTTGGTFTFTTPPSDAALINANTGEVTGGISGTQYSITYTTNGTCPTSSTKTVTAKSLIKPTVSCGNNSKYSLTFNWTVPNGATDYDITYTVNGGSSVAGGNVTTNSYVVSNLSVDDEVVITINTNGTECYDVATGTCVTQSCTPSKASFTFDPLKITNSEPIINFINTSTNSASYYWDFGDGNTSNLDNPTNEYKLDGEASFNVLLIAYNVDGCNDTIIKKIRVEEELIYYVPNAFTPDGDKFNNEFKPVFYSGYDPNNYSMYIFNRWGQLVFETHDIEKGWKGLYGEGGDVVPDGVYTWKIEFKRTITDDVEIAVGTVNLLR